MKFLVDANLPPALAQWLASEGHEAQHVANLGMQASADRDIWQYERDRTRREGRRDWISLAAVADFTGAQSEVRSLVIGKVDIALKRPARQATHGTPEKRTGRFLVSSTIKSVEYDDEARELDITFTSGKTYRYFSVPLEIYAELLDAGSKGKFFNNNIKGAFAFAEVGRR